MPTIPLTRGYETLVDATDFERFGYLKWSAQTRRPRNVYAHRSYHGITVLLHRLILGVEKGVFVDHINGNTLDNRRANLRICNPAQNTYNRRRVKLGRSGFLGVWPKSSGFRGCVMLCGKRYFTSIFLRPEEAAAARDRLARELHGEFAALNFNAA